MATDTERCCPEGYPEEWQDKEIRWEEKLFVKGRVRSFLHVPLNFGSVLKRNVRLIEAAGAMPEEMLVLSDENSLWGADLYIAATRDVPQAEMVRLSGTFLTRVFEGPFREIPHWIADMKQHVASRNREIKHIFFHYRTCPRCAKKYGKNYVILLAQV